MSNTERHSSDASTPQDGPASSSLLARAGRMVLAVGPGIFCIGYTVGTGSPGLALGQHPRQLRKPRVSTDLCSQIDSDTSEAAKANTWHWPSCLGHRRKC